MNINNIDSVVEYYVKLLQQDPNLYNNFLTTTNDFKVSFSNYVKLNLGNKILNNLNTELYQYDQSNNLISFGSSQLNPYIKIQPSLHIDNKSKAIYNLNFNVSLYVNDIHFNQFFYLKPFDDDYSFTLFSNLLYIIQYYMDNTTMKKFYDIIHFVNSIVYNNLMINDPKQNIDSNQDVILENESDLLTKFVHKYNNAIQSKYDANILNEMNEEKLILFNNLSDFFNNVVIGKNYRYNNYLDTLQNYTSVYDTVNLDKEIYFVAQYFPNLTIRPIIEFSFLKDELQTQQMITIDFVKFEISYFNKFLKEDKFDTVLTIIPYENNISFSNFLDLYIILQCADLDLFNNPEDVDNKISILMLLPFLNTFCDSLLKIDKIMKNPQMKKSIEANYLKKNINYNEEELEVYLEDKF